MGSVYVLDWKSCSSVRNPRPKLGTAEIYTFRNLSFGSHGMLLPSIFLFATYSNLGIRVLETKLY